jgi:PAS domain S-box-containing protein
MKDVRRLKPEMVDHLMSCLPGMVYRCLNDNVLTLLYVSEGCKKVTGYEPQELIDGYIIGYEELILPEDRALMRETMDRSIENNTGFQITYRIRHRDDSIRWVWEQGIAFQDPVDKNTYLHGVIIDISCARDLEERLEESIEELEQLNLMKGRFLNFVLHDLQDPVLSFISLSNFLVQNIDDFSKEELVDFLNQIKDSSYRMSLMLGEIYKWAKFESKMTNPTTGLIRLDALISDLRLHYRPLLQSKKLIVKLDCPPDAVIYSDVDVLSLLVGVVLSNAIKYSHPGGEVRMNLTVEDELLKFVVSDDGVGIPSSKINNLFSMKNDYFQSGTNNENGSGLGLVLAKRALVDLGGSITVESKLGKGSTFTIILPVGQQKHI